MASSFLCAQHVPSNKVAASFNKEYYMKDFSIRLPHRSGGLADGTNAISLASANLKSVAAMSFGNEALVRLIPDDVDAARNVLRKRNVPFEETDVTTVLLENRAGSLTELATELA